MSLLAASDHHRKGRLLGLALLLSLGISQGLPLGRAEQAQTVAASGLRDNQAPWKVHKVKHGITVERRPVLGSQFYEYRVIVSAKLPPETVIEQMWSKVLEENPYIKKRQILKQEPDEYVIYYQIRTPVISDRDYTMRIRRISDAKNRRYELTFDTANELGPPLEKKFVRVPVIHGIWQIELGESESSRMSFRTYGEPGGSVPAWMTHGAQVDQVIRDVEKRLASLQELSVPK